MADVDTIQELLELATRYGVTHLRAGDVEFTLVTAPPAAVEAPSDSFLTTKAEAKVEDLSKLSTGPAMYDHKTLFPNGRPSFPTRPREE